MNVRSLDPCQLRVLLVLGELGHAVKADVVAAAGLEEGKAEQALRSLVGRELAEAGSFDGKPYGYRLTGEGTACALKAA